MEVAGQTVTVHRYDEDRYGDRVETASFTIRHAIFAPTTTTEDTDRAQQVNAEAVLYVLQDPGVLPSDVVELEDGSRWEVAGRPQNWDSPWGSWRPGVVIGLNRTTG